MNEVFEKYIEENASDLIKEKIKSGKKTISGGINYVKSQAKEQAKNGCAMIEDKVVFGWFMHYMEEDSIKDTEKVKAAVSVSKPVESKKPYKASEPEMLTGQMNIFDFLN